MHSRCHGSDQICVRQLLPADGALPAAQTAEGMKQQEHVDAHDPAVSEHARPGCQTCNALLKSDSEQLLSLDEAGRQHVLPS